MSKPAPLILLVEDDHDIRRQMQIILNDEGYATFEAENGRVAIDYLAALPPETRPACIILDLMMPVMTGGQFLSALHALGDASLRDIPVIVATAKGSSKEELRDFPPEMVRIRKPMELDELLEAVGRYAGL